MSTIWSFAGPCTLENIAWIGSNGSITLHKPTIDRHRRFFAPASWCDFIRKIEFANTTNLDYTAYTPNILKFYSAGEFRGRKTTEGQAIHLQACLGGSGHLLLACWLAFTASRHACWKCLRNVIAFLSSLHTMTESAVSLNCFGKFCEQNLFCCFLGGR